MMDERKQDKEKKIKNPILSGVYPDPSICRVDDDFYMVCSSFELYPGLPVFHSRDLANWEQIGYAMTIENDFHVEANFLSNGVMAPTIRYCNGVFYIINCNYCGQGNYMITARDPAGPWSKPHWLTDVPGIDASLFFDEDGKSYMIGTGDVVKRTDGTMERGIWLAEYDIMNYKMIGEQVTIWDSALRNASSPESPHIYKVGEYYYLIIAEGGTEHYHAVTVARSKELMGWYEGNPANPVMTHRQFGFSCPIVNVGHADLVDTPSGNWYAVLLASRAVEGYYKNLGRETFICPVIWERGWPVFSPQSGKIDWEYPADAQLPWTEYASVNEKDDFDSEQLAYYWNFWGTPYKKFWRVKDSKLFLKCMPRSLAEELKPVGFGMEKVYGDCVSFLGRRQQHIHFTATCAMSFIPSGMESAGIIVMQAYNHQYRLERAAVDWSGSPGQVLRMVQVTTEFDRPAYLPGFSSITHEKILAEMPWDKENLILQIRAAGQKFTFFYGEDTSKMQILEEDVDGRLINPEIVGGMMGTMLGMFASGNHTDSKNEAAFDWFWYEEI